MILIKPHLTEKTIATTSQSGFTFQVIPGATKSQIRQAIEATFGVNVTRVTTRMTHVPGKRSNVRRTTTNDSRIKYATAYLKKGQSIALFEFKENK
jgi:large subunit ribosomal protein L23